MEAFENKKYKWISKEYFEKALRKFYKDESLVLEEIQVKPAVGKGENYAGVIDRVSLAYKSGSKNKASSVILKYNFENDAFVDHVYGEYKIFDREMKIYERILPKLSFYLQNITNANEKTFADTVFVDFENQAMLLEDLSLKKFVTGDRIAKLDFEHAKLVLKKLAYMHAASALMEEQFPGTFSGYDRGFFNKYTNTFSNMFVGNLKVLTNCVAKWGKNFEYYRAKLEKLQEHIMDFGLESFTPKKEDFNCFVHGDIWTPNVMFTYGTNKSPLQAVLIDFQFAFWGSPTIDLHYFINSSCKDDLRYEREEEVVQYYFYNLKDTLKKLNFKGKIPTLHEFNVQYEKTRFYGECSRISLQKMISQ